MKSSRWLLSRMNGKAALRPHTLATLSVAIIAGVLLAGCDPAGNPEADIAEVEPGNTPAGAAAVEPLASAPAPKSQAQLEADFNSSRAIIGEAKAQAVFSQFKAGHQVQLSSGWDTLKVHATGDDPQFFLPPFGAGRRFIIEAVVQSPADTIMQIYYLRTGQNQYNGDQVRTSVLKEGRNTVYFELDAPDLIDPLRVDIGTVPGHYVVESMIARGLPPK